MKFVDKIDISIYIYIYIFDTVFNFPYVKTVSDKWNKIYKNKNKN